MTLRRLFPLTLLAFFLAIVSIGLVAKVRAQPQPTQSDASQQIIPSIEFQNTDIRHCLQSLFKIVNISYSIQPEVQGTVTVSLKNVTFETALQNVLRQVDSTYRVSSGVYEIIRRSAPATQLPNFTQEPGTLFMQPPSPPAASMTQDGKFLYLFTNNTIYKIQKSDLKIVMSQAIGFSVGRAGNWANSSR